MSQLDNIFSALSDPTRRAIVAALAEGPCTMSRLAEPFDMSLAAVSKHVDVLGRAGLVERKRHGRYIECSLNSASLKPVSDWVGDYERFWLDRLDNLEAVIREKRSKTS